MLLFWRCLLFEREGSSTLEGGAGDDTLDAGFSSGNVLRGSAGNDRYLIPPDATKVQIQDTDGIDRLDFLDFPGNISTSPALLALSSGNIGLTRQGTSLLIDINKDGIARATDDIVISDFFGASATVAGAGFIETVGNLTGSAILAANLTEATAAPGSSASTGTPGNDSLTGTVGNDNISGLEGNDTIVGLDGNDTLLGGAGNDNLSGGGGNDSLLGGEADNTLDGGIGNDFLDGGFGKSILTGGNGDDTLRNSLNLDGGAGNDSLIGSFKSLVLGGDGNDFLRGNGDSTLEGGAGNDTLNAGFGSGNVLRGGTGDDRYLIPPDATQVKIEDTAGIDRLDFVDFNNNISTSPALLALSSGNIGLARQGTNLLIDINKDGIARATDDIVISDFFGASATVAGAGFIETVANLSGTAILTANLTEATAARGSSAISGTPGNDNLIGTAGNDNISGLEGNDTLVGLDGNDTLIGGGGNNSLSGGGGNDSLLGGNVDDTLDGGVGNDFLDGGFAGKDSLAGGDGDDTLVNGFNLDGGAGNDSLLGGFKSLVLGGDGNDYLSGKLSSI